MNKQVIICVGRQLGSGGHDIARMLALDFNGKYYDRELMNLAAKESGFCEEILMNHDERPTNSFLYNLVIDTYSFGYNSSSFVDMPMSQKVFLAQFDTIKKIADEGPCVIVGRCADYALEGRDNVINLFIYADEDFRVRKIMEQYGMDENKARDNLVKKDKQRASYYNYYTNRKWGRAESYDLCINSAVLGIDGSVKLIKQFVEDFESKA